MNEPAGSKPPIVEGQVLIGGEWYDKEERFPSYNPVTGKPIGEAPLCNASDVSRAHQAARKAFEEWSEFSLSRRIHLMESLKGMLSQEADAVAQIVSHETGKPLQEAYLMDILPAMDFLSGLLRDGPKFLRDRSFRSVNPILWSKENWVHTRPLGVVGVIGGAYAPFSHPWSASLSALAGGNTVVFKPSQDVPLSALKMATLIHRSGFPAGTFNIVTGGEDTEGYLAGEEPDALVFQGHPARAEALLKWTSLLRTRVHLDIYGDHAFFVLSDAPLERAVNAAVWGGCCGSIRIRGSVRRVMVHRSLWDGFSEGAREAAAGLRTGDPFDPGVQVGPLPSRRERDCLAAWVEARCSEGAEVLCGGRSERAEGWFWEPTVLDGSGTEGRRWGASPGGPILVLSPFDDEREAVSLLSAHPGTKSASFWTRNLERGQRLARLVRAEWTTVNDIAYDCVAMRFPRGGILTPFGDAVVASGLLKHLTVPHAGGIDKGKRRRELWWYPYDLEGLEMSRSLHNIYNEDTLGRLSLAGPILRRWLRTVRFR